MTDRSKQLIEQVQQAIHDKTPLTIQGNNTKAALGRTLPEQTVLSVAEHHGVVKYEPAELVLTVRAGTTLTEIDDVLAEQGQMLASDPRRFQGQATIGGSLATNQSGAARPWFGSLRDHVLGLRLINGKGEHLQFGGQVMKNVAGYDVSRLQAGAMGTLGVITGVSLKVLPKPDFSLTLAKTVDCSESIALMNQLTASTKPLTGVSWADNTLYLRLQGSKQAILATAQQWRQQYQTQELAPDTADQFWDNLREHQLGFFTQDDSPLFRFSINANAPHVLDDKPWLFNWSGSQRWLKGEFDLAELSEMAKQMGGEVQLYEGGQAEQERSLQNNPVMQRLHKNVKQALDPHAIFNRGRLYSWL